MKNRLMVVFVLLAATMAMAQSNPPTAPHPRAAQALADYLQLTPDQIAAWRQINADTAAAVKPLAANARDLQSQLQAALQAATPDAAAAGKLALSLHEVRDQIRAAHEASDSKRAALLTPEQKTKFAAFQAAMQFLRQQRRAAE